MRRSGLPVGSLNIARMRELWLMDYISPRAVRVGGQARRSATGGSVNYGAGGRATVDEGFTLMVHLFTGGGEGGAVDSVGFIFLKTIIGSGGGLFLHFSG